MSIIVIVSPAKAGRFHASVGSRHLGTFRTPLLSAARVLLSEDVEPSASIVMRHEGTTFDALRSTVGAAAKLTVKEPDDGDRKAHFAAYRAGPENRPSLIPATQHHPVPDLAEIDGYRDAGNLSP